MNNLNNLINHTIKYIHQLKAEDMEHVIKSEYKDKIEQELGKLYEVVKNCKKCPLSNSRKNTVFGEGNQKAKLMFVGEGPGFDEDRLGRPFVGKAGKLLDDIITVPKALGLKRADVYIANIVKCHPMIDPSRPDKRGNDRKPSREEASACLPYLEKQIELIKPKIICALGSVSAVTLTGLEMPMGKLRGRFYDYKGIKVMPTYHPAALLRNPGWKVDTWEDIKKIKKELAL